MNSKNWKSLMVWLRANTTAQPHEIETPEDALAVAFLKLAAVNPIISGFDVPRGAVYWQQFGRAKRSAPIITDFADPTKEYRIVPFSSIAPEGDGWTLHSSTSFDATWVRDAKTFDCSRWPGCGCPDGTIAADCPGTTS